MTKFEVMHKTVAVVSFHEPEKARKFFLSENWQKSFWEVEDLEDLASKMADSFAREGDSYRQEIGFFREMEGSGPSCRTRTTRISSQARSFPGVGG